MRTLFEKLRSLLWRFNNWRYKRRARNQDDHIYPLF